MINRIYNIFPQMKQLFLLFLLSFMFINGISDVLAQNTETPNPRGISRNSPQRKYRFQANNIERGDAIYETLRVEDSLMVRSLQATEAVSIERRDAINEGVLTGKTDEQIDQRLEEINENYRQTQEAILSLAAHRSQCTTNDDCLPYCYYLEAQSCPFCNLFKTFFNASSNVTYKSIMSFSGAVFKVVIIAFAVWLAIQTLAFVSSPETRDIKDFIQSALTQAFIIAFVCILLNNNVMNFMNQFLEPVFNTGLNIAQATLSPETWLEKNETQNLISSKKVVCEKDYGIYTSSSGNADTAGALPVSMGNSLLCTLSLIDDRATKVKALASSAICQSWKEKFFIIPKLSYFLTGVGLWIGSVLLIIGVPFLLLDCVIELAIAGALLPAAVGAYAFKMTRKYTKKVWDSFLNTMFSFLFMSLIVLMLTEAFSQILSETSGAPLDELVLMTSENDIKILFDDLSWFSFPFIKIVFVLVLTWTMVKEARDFAGDFSENIANTSFGSEIGTMGASAAKGVATKVGKPIASAAGKKLWQGTKWAARAPVHGARRALLKRQARKTQARALSGGKGSSVTTNQDGSTTYSYTERKRTWYAPWQARQVTRSATIGADGGISYRRESLTKKGTLRVKEKNEHFSVRSKYKRDKQNGGLQQIGKERIRYNSSKSRRLFNSKNQLNADRFNEIMSSGGSDTMKIAAMKTIVGNRMPGMNVKKTKTMSHSILRGENGEILGYREIMRDGTVHEMKYTTGNGRMKIDFTTLDANGKGTTLSTDGIINRKRTFNGSRQLDANGNITGIDVDQSSVKDAYGLTSYYEKYQRQRRFNRIDYNESLFSADEVQNAQQYMQDQKHWWRDANMTEFGPRN